MTRLFESVKGVGRSMGERSDCGVIAISIVCNVSYEKAHAALKSAGRRNKGLVYDFQLTQALKDFGYCCTGTIQKAQLLKPRTTKTIEREPGLDGRWLVFTASHVAAMVEGTLHDWTTERNKRITHLWRIERCK